MTNQRGEKGSGSELVLEFVCPPQPTGEEETTCGEWGCVSSKFVYSLNPNPTSTLFFLHTYIFSI